MGGSASVSNTARLSTGAQASATVTIQGQGTTTSVLLDKTVSNPTPADGEIITYTVTMSNTGSAIPSITLRDAFGERGGVLTGNRGGTVTFRGTETVTATANGAPYAQRWSGSIGARTGLILTDVPANARITVTYQAVTDARTLGFGVTSGVINTVSTTGALDAVTVTLTGRNRTQPPVPNGTTGRTAPFILPIPTQVQLCGGTFERLDLTQFIGDGDNTWDQLLIAVDGNRRLQARIVDGFLIVTDPTGVQENLQENLRITVRDPSGLIATRTIPYSILRNQFQQPVLSGIPDQIIRSGNDFEEFVLDEYTQIGGVRIGNRTIDYYATGSTLFDVTIDDQNRVEIAYDENLFRASGVDQISEEITFTVRGCSGAKDTAVFTVVRKWPEQGGVTVVDTGSVAPRTCAVVVQGRPLPDTDCDGVLDAEDNCVQVRNPDQGDANRDGRGDACDLFVTCAPDVATALDAGQAVNVRIEATNNLPSEATTVRYGARIVELNVGDERTSVGLRRGETGTSALRVRIPACVTSGRYTLECRAQAGPIVQTARIPIRIEASNACTTGGASNATIYEMQDVIAGSPYGASFPVVITNGENRQRTYALSVDGILPWGDYTFEEGSVLVVPAGATRTTAVRVFAAPETEPASYPFQVIVRAGEEEQTTILRANVVPADVLPADDRVVGPLTVIWFGLVVIVFGIIIYFAYRAAQMRRR
jgi:hypothetical protein